MNYIVVTSKGCYSGWGKQVGRGIRHHSYSPAPKIRRYPLFSDISSAVRFDELPVATATAAMLGGTVIDTNSMKLFNHRTRRFE